MSTEAVWRWTDEPDPFWRDFEHLSPEAAGNYLTQCEEYLVSGVFPKAMLLTYGEEETRAVYERDAESLRKSVRRVRI